MEQFKSGDRVCFVGDSITAQNRYVALIVDHYKTNFPDQDIKIYNCGISGGRAALLHKYFDEDVLAHNPTHIIIMLGVNDSNFTSLGGRRTAERYELLEKYYEIYKTDFAQLCQKAKSVGAKVTLLTPTPYAEYQDTSKEVLHKGAFALLAVYAEFVRNYAKENGFECIDVHSFITKQMQTKILFNDDCFHPNDLGHHCIAKSILQSQGLDIGEPKDFPEYLEKWRQAVICYRGLYAVEYMVIPDNIDSVKEKIEFVKDYLENKKYVNSYRAESVNLFFKKVSEEYVQNKLRQKEMFLEIDKIYDETKIS